MSNRLGRKVLVSFWIATTFAVATYYNACGKVQFAQSARAILANMQSTAFILINNDAIYTNNEVVDVALDASQADEVYVTNDSTCAAGGKWEPLRSNKTWTLGQINNQATVYAKFRNLSEGIETDCINDSIIHDGEKPLVVLNSPSAATNVQAPVVLFVASDAISGLDKMFCEWPGKAVTECNFSTSNGNLAEGRYLVKISAKDRAGNVSDPQVHDLVVDRTPPVITLLASPPALSNIVKAQYNFNVTDDRSGVKSIECSWDNNVSFAACTAPTSRDLAEGAHKLYIRARDNAGNEAIVDHSFAIDLSAPTVRILTGPPDYSKVKTATFTFDGNDDGVPITKFECRLDGGAWSSCTSPKDYAGLAEGLRTFEVRGFDQADNPSAPASRSWYVDTIAPVVAFVKTPPALTKESNAGYKYTITDSGSGVDKAQCNLDNSGFKDCDLIGSDLNGLAEGPHTFQVRGYDKAGNYDDGPVHAFTIDKQPPTLMFTDTPGSLSKLADFLFKFQAMDANGIEKVECRLDGGNYMDCNSVTQHQVTGLTEGDHIFTIRALDRAGNQSQPVSHSWQVDLTPPMITYFQNPPATLLTGQKLILGFNVADTGSGVKSLACTLDGNAVPCQSGVIVNTNIAKGTHNFVVIAVDNAGNTAMDTKTIVVNDPLLKNQDIDIKSTSRVDVLVVMDNSGSMATEMKNMADRMSTFTNQLAGLEWQLGIITTDVKEDKALKDGRMVKLKGVSPEQYILDHSWNPAQAAAVFANTVQMDTNGSGNEEGFKAAIRAMERSQSTATVNAPNRALFRADAALAIIVVSDSHDTSGTTPENVIAKVKSYWPDKPFAWHSVVVPESEYTIPNASGNTPNANDPCKNYREAVQRDGREYHRLSDLTGGIKGTVCSTDYGSQLKDMGKVTADLVKSVSLDCQPVDFNQDGKLDYNDVSVVDPNGNAILDFTVMGNKLTFANYLPNGLNKFQYYCVQ